MSKKAKKPRSVTEEQLWKLHGQGTCPGAKRALEEVRRIKEAGHVLAIYYSEFNDFTVLDENDPDQCRMSMAMSLDAGPFET